MMRFSTRLFCTAMMCCVAPAFAADPTPAPNSPVAPVTAPATTEAAPFALKSVKDQYSYAIGVTTVRNFSKENIAFDADIMIRGMRDAMAGGKLVMSEKDLTKAMGFLQENIRRSQVLNKRELQEKNRKRGSEFQAQYKKREGVASLPNGVMYRVLKAGTGDKPSEMDSIVVNYRGMLTDGVEFDASQEGKPATMRLIQGIMGWREALKNMPKGSQWEIVIPHMLAYGERGVGSTIGPNETLVFEVELVDIKSLPKPEALIPKSDAAIKTDAKKTDAK